MNDVEDVLPGRSYVVRSATFSGQLYEFHENGFVVAARAVETTSAPVMFEDEHKFRTIEKWIVGPAPENGAQHDTGALIAFLGAPEWMTEIPASKCVACKGTGVVEHDCDCDHCDIDDDDCDVCDGGTEPTRLDPVVRRAVVGGLPLNGNFLACALSVVGAEGPCAIWSPDAYLTIVAGEGWRAVVMGMKADAESAVWEGAPTFAGERRRTT